MFKTPTNREEAENEERRRKGATPLVFANRHPAGECERDAEHDGRHQVDKATDRQRDVHAGRDGVEDVLGRHRQCSGTG